MAIQPFLAMTAAEMQNLSTLPPKTAWMACHFSLSGQGLSNLPDALTPGTVLILDDNTPLCGQDPKRIGAQLSECSPETILLDFQRPLNPETAALVHYLGTALPCPVVVSDIYAKENELPVFLSPVPPSVPVEAWLSPWKGRDVWLDIAPNGETLRLTEAGCQILPMEEFPLAQTCFTETTLHCQYQICCEPDHIDFHLWRTRENLMTLLEEAEALGVTHAVGLYQEWKP